MTWLVAGLGNPGAKYYMTRHNIGFMVAEKLALKAGASFQRSTQNEALIAQTVISASGLGVPGGEKLVISEPVTYMNESGRAVGKITKFFKTQPDHVIVVHDELDIDLGQLRLKLGGGDNGHNGLKSIRAHLGTGDFYRVRVGIGRPQGRQDAASYVLTKFPTNSKSELELQIELAADAIETIITKGLAAAQNRFNN